MRGKLGFLSLILIYDDALMYVLGIDTFIVVINTFNVGKLWE
jgi:hypothetical protein